MKIDITSSECRYSFDALTYDSKTDARLIIKGTARIEPGEYTLIKNPTIRYIPESEYENWEDELCKEIENKIKNNIENFCCMDVHDLYPSLFTSNPTTLNDRNLIRKAFDYMTFHTKPNPKHVMYHNGTTILEIGNNKIVVKCDNRDTFDPVIGLKNAIYRFYKKWGFRDTDKGHEDSIGKKFIYMEKVFGEYSEEMKDLAFAHLCGYDEKYCAKLIKKLMKYENGKWIDL